MKPFIYLDNAATTEPSAEALAETAAVQQKYWANPNSPHVAGVEANRYLEECRRRMGAVLGCDAWEVIFTSGGTEADVLAVRGAARKGAQILVGATEHPAVIETALKLREEGLAVEFIPVDAQGVIREDRLVELLGRETRLVSVQLANSEIGTVQQVGRLASLVKRVAPGCLVHCDAVQGFGKLPLPMQRGTVDLLTVSSHKIHGPKGAGALFVKKGTTLRPVMTGGRQEMSLRGGTQNLAAIAGFVVAAEVAQRDREMVAAGLEAAGVRLREGLARALPMAVLTGHPTQRSPGHVSVKVPGILSQNLLHFMEEQGVLASSGSACHSMTNKLSHVLEAIGQAGGMNAFVRLCPSRHTTNDELDQAVEVLAAAAKRLLGKEGADV